MNLQQYNPPKSPTEGLAETHSPPLAGKPGGISLSIVIVSYNVQYFLLHCLHSIRGAASDIALEIFVVDNSSIDGTCEAVIQQFPEVQLIQNTENVGFAKACNQAIHQAQGAYILLLNPDTMLSEDSLKLPLAYMEAHEKCGALGVKMLDGSGNFLPESKRGLPTYGVALCKLLGLQKLFPHASWANRYYASHIHENETAAVEVLSGAYFLVRAELLQQVGLLNEAYFMYGEDIDLSYKITQAGFENVYFPETSIIHYKGECTPNRSMRSVYNFYKAMLIFVQTDLKVSKIFVPFLWIALFVSVAAAWCKRNVFALARKVKPKHRVLIVGSGYEPQRVEKFLRASNFIGEIAGYISLTEEFPNTLNYIGTRRELPHLIQISGITEIIFCIDSMSVSEVIAIIHECALFKISFKIADPHSRSVVGSTSPQRKGELYEIRK
ncbi:MAG: glycosyltransferase [Bacteroidales bacterium]|jgi:GT2 family glycosyltransferase|nr:glycosyltransferase [Bacteroidales bacterium]